ncbi:MAG: hypothetical protein HZA90_23455 [Verrucomicrobia bacterium]|nr:hypothetical protein [Verrucomicrobiota bacterium]
MNSNCAAKSDPPLRTQSALLLAAGAVAAFHLAYTVSACSFMVVVFLACLFTLSRVATSRRAFYFGLGIGLAIYGPQLSFFWNVFGPAAVALWAVLAFWIGLFVLLTRACRARLGPFWAAVLAPFLWTGLEYFRSELYYLRFSWLNIGYAFSDSPQLLALAGMGVYGIGFELMGAVGLVSLLPRRPALATATALLVALGFATNWPARNTPTSANAPSVRVAAMQMEFPAALEVPLKLDQLQRAHPAAELLVLSEYTFDGALPARVTDWCRRHTRHLIAGGKDDVDDEQFFNTAFVAGPDGSIVFKQAKAVPIQFFKDGLPAREQKVWRSPWGALGLATCYDLSYTRVMDRLVELGAEGLIVPTMDVADWGAHEHRLHARIGPMRAAEYGLPVFRVASSGISQLIDRRGRVLANAPFPGENAILGGKMKLGRVGFLPPDRTLAEQCAWFAALVLFCLACSPLTDLPWRVIRFPRHFVLSSPTQNPSNTIL